MVLVHPSKVKKNKRKRKTSKTEVAKPGSEGSGGK